MADNVAGFLSYMYIYVVFYAFFVVLASTYMLMQARKQLRTFV